MNYHSDPQQNPLMNDEMPVIEQIRERGFLLPDEFAGVLDDLEKRQAIGLVKYGSMLKPFNGRCALIDLYQEITDAIMYATQYEMELEMLEGLQETCPRTIADDGSIDMILSDLYDMSISIKQQLDRELDV